MTAATVLWETDPTPDAALRICERRYVPGAWQPRHSHARAQLTLVCSGSVDERVGPRQVTGEPLSVAIKPAGIEHADRIGPRGARTFQLSIGRDVLATAERDEQLAWGWLDGGQLVGRLCALARLAREPEDPASLEGAAFDVLAAAGRAQHTTSPRAHSSESRGRLRRLVDESYRSGTSVRALAAALGRHPVTVARHHRDEFGCSITERWAFLRTRESARRLAETDESAATIALAAGFSDQSHMGRVFRRWTGTSPGAYRRAVRS